MSNAGRDDASGDQSGAVYTPGSQGALYPPQVRIAEKVYLTMDEAMKLSGLSTEYLQGKIKSGHLRVLEDGEPKIRRSDLEGI